MAWHADTILFLIIFLVFNPFMMVVIPDMLGKLVFAGWILSSIIAIVLIAYLEHKEHGKGST